MLQFDELRLRLENMLPEIEDLSGAIGLSQMEKEVAELDMRASADGVLGRYG